MKKMTALLLTGFMTLSLAACGGTAGDKTKEGKETKTKVSDEKTETYKITYNMNDGNTTDMPGYQFLGADFSGIINVDSRLYIEETLKLDGSGKYELISDCYVVETGERQEVGAVTGIGQTWIMTAKGTYTDNGDGTITTSDAASADLEVKTDTYSSQMKDAVAFAVAGSSEDGKWSSSDTPEILEFVPETVFTVADGEIISYVNPNASAEAGQEDGAEGTGAAAGDAAVVIPSDDQGTVFNLYSDGTYTFVFESYDITDAGTYTYADGVLTITDKNGAVATSTADGDHLKFHYAYSDSDQLTGDYTVAAAELEGALK